jgi:anti-sigma regulatory factor (Ser/Thr protein kinase)
MFSSSARSSWRSAARNAVVSVVVAPLEPEVSAIALAAMAIALVYSMQGKQVELPMDERAPHEGEGARAPRQNPAEDPIEARLPRNRDCGAIARRLVERHFGTQVSTAALDDLKLVVSELVDNAYLHGEGEIRLTMRGHGHAVHLEVLDEGEGAAIEIRETQPQPGGGFGLKLVETLSSAWGAYEGTTHVWALVPLE